MAQLIGRATVKNNGKVLLIDKGAKLNLGGIGREPVVGTEVWGHVEEIHAPYVECSISVSKDTDLAELQNMSDGTTVFEADNGQTWVLKNAFSSLPPEITAGEGGKVPVKIYGLRCDKM